MPEDTIPGARVRATTKHGELSVDEIAEMQPGGARLMDELAHRYWVLYYAAKGGNWDLARYMERESEKLLAILGTARPKYAADLDVFVKENLGPLDAAIRARDWPAFEAAYRAQYGDVLGERPVRVVTLRTAVSGLRPTPAPRAPAAPPGATLAAAAALLVRSVRDQRAATASKATPHPAAVRP